MNILQEIVAHKHDEVAYRKQVVPFSELFAMEMFKRKTFSLQKALTGHPRFSIIAEIKRASPTAGEIHAVADLQSIARDYDENGAAAISVLTDEHFFRGSLKDLHTVRQTVKIPLLRKDFIIHEYQLFEAKAYGADAVLLIASILDRIQLKELHTAAREMGLECLVELYDSSEINILDFNTMKLIGINNRDLKTFSVDLQRTITMAEHLPKTVTIVSESGIHSIDDIRRLQTSGISAALIGEYFMKSENPGSALRKMLQGLAGED